MSKKIIHIIGGGTFSHVRNHLALAAPAFGTTAKDLHKIISQKLMVGNHDPLSEYDVELHLTKMADSNSKIVTNEDVADLLEKLKADRSTRAIILNAALCDYDGAILEGNWQGNTFHEKGTTKSGSHATRLKTSEGFQTLQLLPASKLIGEIRKDRKDIFVVGFKTTTDETSDEQYRIGLNMLKRDSLNLVFANDTVTRNNMIITPEEARYSETTDRFSSLVQLANILLSRIQNTFTRSTVVDGEPVPWDSPLVPENLRKVVDYCIEKGAYKPFRGATVGHFAFRVDDKSIVTSKRKSNFNDLREIGMVKVEYGEGDNVIAYGAKPSVGGQSQRIIFKEHEEVDCIIHFHCPMKEDAELGRNYIPVTPQWPNECGSHQCGQNTSNHLESILYESDDGKEFDDNVVFLNRSFRVAMLENHGPNIAFSRHTDPDILIDFIEKNFDLTAKTGGLVA